MYNCMQRFSRPCVCNHHQEQDCPHTCSEPAWFCQWQDQEQLHPPNHRCHPTTPAYIHILQSRTENIIVKLGVQELLSLGLLSSSTKDTLSRSPLDPWSLSKGPSINSLIKRYVLAREVSVWFMVQYSTVQYHTVQYNSHSQFLNSKEPSKN